MVIPREPPQATQAVVGALAAFAAYIPAPLLGLCAVDNTTMMEDMHAIPQIR